jgi:hypothetical protein
MDRRLRRLAWVLLGVLLVGGLLLAGPGHALLHHDHAEAPCDACALTGTEGPEELEFPGPAHELVLRVVPLVERIVEQTPTLVGRPRGPPAA